MRILLAEDEPAGRTYMVKQLERLGYEVVVATDGLAAWELFARDPFEVVMTDIMMPGLDGLDLCRRIRELSVRPFYTFVILITALKGKQWYLKGLEAGANDFLTKPATFYELVVRLSVAEHTLHLERGMRHLEAALGACPSCRSVATPDGRWIPVRSLLATSPPPSEHERCPDCLDADAHAQIAERDRRCLA